MRKFTTIICLLFASAVFGQTKTINIPTYTSYQSKGDSTLWFKWKYSLAEKLELPNLQTSKDTHFILDFGQTFKLLIFGHLTVRHFSGLLQIMLRDMTLNY